jgi:exosome complex RNA-binding protein Rrp42 (RNase PH superfamily)
MERVLLESNALPLETMGIIPGKVVWMLYIDVVVHSHFSSSIFFPVPVRSSFVLVHVHEAQLALCCDISQVLSSGGNLLDAIALAIRAALIKTTLPKVDVVKGPSGAPDDLDFEISDDPFAATPLASQNVPIVVTLCKVGDSLVSI